MIALSLVQPLLDRAVRAARGQTPRVDALLQELEGQRLAVIVSGTPARLLLHCSDGSLHLSADNSTEAQAQITAAPLSLWALVIADDRGALQRGAVRIDGDAEVAQRFQLLLQLLRPDFEHLLAGPLGRSVAHLLMRAGRHAADWTRAAVHTQARNVAEYLAHESGDLVSQPEGEHFARAVEQLREQLDRVDARLRDLEQRGGKLAGTTDPA